MAKQLYEIKDFASGLMTNADLKDLPDGASDYTINIDFDWDATLLSNDNPVIPDGQSPHAWSFLLTNYIWPGQIPSTNTEEAIWDGITSAPNVSIQGGAEAFFECEYSEGGLNDWNQHEASGLQNPNALDNCTITQ